MDQPILNKILVVEDEADIQTITQVALQDIGGFTVKFCSSGHEALEVVESYHPDLILLDMMMPGMDGIETLQAIRAMPAVAHIPIVFMTAKVQANEITQYCEIGALGVIPKPFNPIQLPELLQKIWKERK